MKPSAFGMTYNDGLSTRVAEHLGTQISGKRTRSFGVAILPTEDNALTADLNCARNECRRRTDENVARGGLRSQLADNGLDFHQGGGNSVHLPVARDQLAHFFSTPRRMNQKSRPGSMPMLLRPGRGSSCRTHLSSLSSAAFRRQGPIRTVNFPCFRKSANTPNPGFRPYSWAAWP